MKDAPQRLACFFVTVMLLLFSDPCAAAMPPVKENPLAGDGLQSLYWLVDDWALMQNDRTSSTFESWQNAGDSLLRGVSFSISPAGDTTIHETIELALRDGALWYIPTVQGQNHNKPVPFRLSAQKGTSWTFENKAHDFPTQIQYTLAGFDTLQAHVSGPGKELRYTYVRKPRIQRFEVPGEDGPVVMRKFWLLSYLVGPDRNQSKEEAARIQAGHMAHLNSIYKAGKSCVAGPTDGGEVRGFVVFTTATKEEAMYIGALDPAVQSGRLTCRIEAWWAMEGAVLK